MIGFTVPQFPGELGTFQAVAMMKQLVNKSYLHPWIRERAALVTNSCDRGDLECQEVRLFKWVQNKMSYQPDPEGIEALSDPVTWVEKRIRYNQPVFGDCDDMATYLAALLKSIGHNPQFRVMGRNPNSGWHHVAVVCDDRFLDPTHQLGQLIKKPARAIRFPI